MPESVPRAVLDTNVLVSALTTPNGASARLLIELRAGTFEVVVSPMLLEELSEVLRRPKFRRYATEADVDEYVDLVRREAIVRDDPEPVSQPLAADPADEYLVALARGAGVDALVSGDAHLLDLRHRIPAMSPTEFLQSL